MKIRALSLSLLLLAGSFPALAAPPKNEEIPESLRAWQDWVLHGQDSARCPFFNGDPNTSRCAWPTRVELGVSEKGGTFSQGWLANRSEWAPIPGEEKHWPQSVTVDGAAAVVVPKGGRPGVLLKAGAHTVRGTWLWDSSPESVLVPADTGLLSLTVAGKTVEFPERDAAGRVWLQKKSEEGATENRLEIIVHRKVTDDIPLLLTTQIELHVSGKNREVVLAKALPPDFIPMSLDAPMPARLDPDGHLRVQVWPGNWTVQIVARHVGRADALSMPAIGKGDTWAPEEVWVFEARNNLRLASVEGVPSIDPQQTTLPEAWKRLPTYRLKPSEVMSLIEKRRGDADPAPDQLALSRSLWLDFDGRGYSIQDQIHGPLNRGWRLEMGPETTLGRVAIDGRDQFITQQKPGAPAGVEVRQGQVNLTADSRVESAARNLPAVGWAHDFTNVSGVLHLPPGWRLFAVTGADDVPQTWLRQWSLWDMFLVLILAMAILRLYGPKWGGLALIALVLTFPEAGAPQWAWLAVIACEALMRAVPANAFRKVVNAFRLVTVAILLVIVVSFSVSQIRTGMYPALGTPNPSNSGWLDDLVIGGAKAPEQMTINAPVEAAADVEGRSARDESTLEETEEKPAGNKQNFKAIENDLARGKRAGLPSSSSRYADVAQMNLYEHDPKSIVQTGPGLPRWNWSTVSLGWSGPVAAAQRLTLWLVPPWANFLLALVRVALLAMLLWCLLDLPGEYWPKALAGLAPAPAVKTAAAALAALVILANVNVARAAEVPSPEMLKELQTRLLEKPECFPNCASSARMDLDVQAGSMTIRLEVGAAAATAVPLPGSAEQWIPSQVMLDGRPAPGITRTVDGQLWLELEPGAHQVVMQGALPKRSTVQIRLPLKPHHVTAKTSGWTLAGLHEDGLADDNLQLSRVEEKGAAAAGTLSQGQLPPFVRVERTLTLGLNWQVLTRVVRATPLGSAVVIEVPLLPGENVTTNDVRVVDGRALVNMGAQVGAIEWLSSLTVTPEIKLVAPNATAWTEVWRLDASAIWHAESTGIPVIHAAAGATRTPEWRPWPGEVVTISVARPEGVPGQTLTLDHTSLSVSPGKRATDVTLSMSLRSSRGGQHVVLLPPEAELQSVTIDNQSQPIRQDKEKVTLPVVPGSQEITLQWREPGGIRLSFSAPRVDLGSPSVNADSEIHVPSDRWVLFARGPRLGPAVLFWSLLVVILLVSFGLGRVTFTPLKTWHWMILGLGLSQIPVIPAAIVAGWLLALGLRKKRGHEAGPVAFNFLQLTLMLWTLIALGFLVWAIQQGLLGGPDMQIRGNGSYYGLLRWYKDRADAELPRPWILSVPLWVYRVAMLAWALWLALALLGWLRWGWSAFTDGGFFKPIPLTRKKPVEKPIV